MKHNIILVIVITALVILGVVLYFIRQGSQSPAPAAPEAETTMISPIPKSSTLPETVTETATSTTENPTEADNPASTQPKVLIQMTTKGFVPATQKVKRGDQITFVNNDTEEHWPASDVHPSHRDCPGFDARRGLGSGEKYTFEYKYDRDCYYHDHLKPSLKGELELE